MGRWFDEAKKILENGQTVNPQNPQNQVSKVLRVRHAAVFEKFSAWQNNPPAWHPRPTPRIEGRQPPWGCEDKPPARYAKAWETFCSQLPPSAPSFFDWEVAAFDAAIFLGDWGQLASDYGWRAGDIFDVPHDGKPGGVAWFMRGSPAVAIGPTMAQCQDGRIWRRGRP